MARKSKPKLLVSFVMCLLAVFSSCSKTEKPIAVETTTSTAAPTPEGSTGAPAFDACSLLTSEEIQSVQGEPLQDLKSTGNARGTFSLSQCSFTLPTFTNSISLSVMSKGVGPDARDPKQSWNETFSKETPLMKGTGKTGSPQKIEGLGDEAYWVGNDKIGALNVLKGSHYLTISVGGSGDQASKVEKSRKLAQFALKRL